MKQLTCQDVTPPDVTTDCTFVAKGETNEDVLQQMRDHAGSVHADLMKDATPENMKAWEEMAPTKITDV